MISSAFLAKFFKLRMMSFSFGSFSMGAYAKYGSASIFHAPMATPSAKNGLRLVLYGGFARKSGMSAGTTSPSAVTPCQPFVFL